VAVTNTGSETVEGWEPAWDFTAGEEVRSLWNGSHTQTGSTVTVTGSDGNGRIDPGGAVSVGFNGSAGGEPAAPEGFTLNGQACD
jgi:cellulase/cellobiase CelA1